MTDHLNPGDTAICVFGLCTVLAAITWRDDEVFAYRVELADGSHRVVGIANTRRAERTADIFAWAHAKVQALIENKISIG